MSIYEMLYGKKDDGFEGAYQVLSEGARFNQNNGFKELMERETSKYGVITLPKIKKSGDKNMFNLCIKAINKIDNQKIFENIVFTCKCWQLKLEVIKKIKNADVLKQLALSAKEWNVRWVAIQNLNNIYYLKNLLLSEKDKRCIFKINERISYLKKPDIVYYNKLIR